MLAGMVAFLATLRASLRTQPIAIRTTLYDLIATMQDEVGSEDDALIVNTVTELIRVRRLSFLNEIESQRAEY